MTKTEAAVLRELRTGPLTLSTLSRKIGRPAWLVRRAARSLHRQSLVGLDWTLRYRIYCTAAIR